MNTCALHRDLEEDPLFGEDLSPENRLSGSDWLSASPPQSPDHSKSEGKTEVHKIVNRCTLCSRRTVTHVALLGSALTLTFCSLQLPVFGARRGQVIISR